MFITADNVDPELAEPYTDVDEERTITDTASGVTVTCRYVHGGFTGTNARFSFYFPSVADYRGRFFHHTYPMFTEEDATPDVIAFGISHGAYVVSANNDGGVPASPVLGGYRVNAAAAKFSKVVAAEMYGSDIPTRGYLYGASGGAYQTLGGLENTSGVWAGGVPMVPGTPNSIPSFQGVQMLALRVLGERLGDIADALEPGGNGDPYATLNEEQRSILDEASTLGFPVRGWWQHRTLDGGSFWLVAAGVRAMDPSYVDDFWSLAGYEGADPASSVQADRIQFEATILSIDDRLVTLSATPGGDTRGADLVIVSGAAAGVSVPFVSLRSNTAEVGAGIDTAVLAPGDRVRLDNSWAIALQYYHRHQLPTPDLYGWNQFRDANGEPWYPQRPTLLGPTMARASGGISTGQFNGRMIMLGSVLDVEAYPWSVDWYHQQVRAIRGDDTDDDFRVWFMDNCDHNPTTRTVAAEAHIVSYDGEMQQALLDLDAWVAGDISPPSSTSYRVTARSQIELPESAVARGGVQPTVRLVVATGNEGSKDADVVAHVNAGDALTFTATADLPAGTGSVVSVEWDFESTGSYPVRSDVAGATPIDVAETHTYTQPGTHFAVVRVTARRDGDAHSPFRRIQNVARARIVVS